MASVDLKIQIVLLMAKFDSATQVTRELKKRKFLDVPACSTIKRIFERFIETGLLTDRPRCGRPSIKGDIISLVEEITTINPLKSTRKIADEVGASHTLIHQVMRHYLGLYPYKLQYHQMLYEEDYANRVQCCQDMLQINEHNQNFLKHLIMSDEATFHLNGQVNRHNCRVWGTEKPNAIMNRSQGSPKVNVWIGMSQDGLVGPVFFHDNVNAENYLNMLKSDLIPYLKGKRRATTTYFQQDGAPAHFAKRVRDYLNEKFPLRWIGRMGPIAWPARSPDLTPLDFFLWGYIKTKVYIKNPQNIDYLCTLIREECAKISNDILKNAMQGYIRRMVKCVELDGRHVE